MNNGIFDMIVKPINDVLQKTEETVNLLTQGEPSPSCNSHSMFYSAIILFAQHLIFIGDEYNDINEPLKPP